MLVNTFLELGDAVSENLEFAHANSEKVSYGEETITENNLLEILRRHKHKRTQLTAISKGQEAKTGADWEWVIVGAKYSFFMRVQAKRTRRNNKLSIKHKVGKAGIEQIDILINGCKPKTSLWLPVYCFYSKESERVKWKHTPSSSIFTKIYKYGCLIAPAEEVKKIDVKSIKDVEGVSFPWHCLFLSSSSGADSAGVFKRTLTLNTGVNELRFVQLHESIHDIYSFDIDRLINASKYFPTMDDLNGRTDFNGDMRGVRLTNIEEVNRERDRNRSGDENVARFLMVDVRE